MKVAGVVVLYQPDCSWKENIKSYLPYIDLLYVVDNSPEKTKILNDHKMITLSSKKNLGMAKALNLAAQRAIKDGYDFLLTMDQDSKFTKDGLLKLIEFIKENDVTKVGIVSPYHVIETNFVKSQENIDYPMEVMTSGNLLNLKAYQEVGGFQDKLFIDCVDTEMCLNLRVHGYEIVRLNDALLYHHLGNTEVKNFFGKKVICSNHNPFRRYYMIRNTMYVTKWYHSFFPQYCKYLRKVQRHQIGKVLLFEKQKGKKIRMMLKGYFDYLRKKEGEVYERKNCD